MQGRSEPEKMISGNACLIDIVNHVEVRLPAHIHRVQRHDHAGHMGESDVDLRPHTKSIRDESQKGYDSSVSRGFKRAPKRTYVNLYGLSSGRVDVQLMHRLDAEE